MTPTMVNGSMVSSTDMECGRALLATAILASGSRTRPMVMDNTNGQMEIASKVNGNFALDMDRVLIFLRTVMLT